VPPPYRCRVSTRVLPLAVALLLLGGCVSRTAGPDARPAEPAEPPEPPGQEQVQWVDTLCSATTQLAAEQAQGEDLVSGSRDEIPRFESLRYLLFISSSVDRLVDEFDPLTASRSGFDAADQYAADLAAGLDRVEPEITRLAEDRPAMVHLPEKQLADRAARVAALLGSVELGGGPSALAEQDPAFAAAHELGPNCTPPEPRSSTPPKSSSSGPPPPAADGSDIGSCADGACEVELTGTTDVQVGNFLLQVTVHESSVSVSHDFGGGGGGIASLGSPGGEASFGNGDTTVVIRLVGIEPDTAVLEFGTE